MANSDSPTTAEPLVIRTHVTPWGFAVALPLALAFAYLGAAALDAHLLPGRAEVVETTPLWLLSAVLLCFALVLFLIGIAELANYVKPSVEVVLDDAGLTTWGVLGQRRYAWADVLASELSEGQLALRVRGKARGSLRDVRLQFSRLAVEPSTLVARLIRHRPDLKPTYRAG